MATKRYKVLDILLVPKEDRDDSVGSTIMTKLCGWADVEDVTLVLSADSTVCGRIGSSAENALLVKFYSRFGFVASSIRNLKCDSLITSKNIMERTPKPFLSNYIARLRDLECDNATI